MSTKLFRKSHALRKLRSEIADVVKNMASDSSFGIRKKSCTTFDLKLNRSKVARVVVKIRHSTVWVSVEESAPSVHDLFAGWTTDGVFLPACRHERPFHLFHTKSVKRWFANILRSMLERNVLHVMCE
jgi:hypothetical protein